MHVWRFPVFSDPAPLVCVIYSCNEYGHSEAIIVFRAVASRGEVFSDIPRCCNDTESSTAMSSHKNAPDIVRVTLSPFEGHRLFAFLNELVERGAPETDFSVL